MEYRTYHCNPKLNPFVRCIWTLEASLKDDIKKQRIVPDGCMELIFHYGDPYAQYVDNGAKIIQPRSFVFGQITKPLFIEPTGDTSIFAIRFTTYGFLPFSTINLNEMQDRAVSLVEIYGQDGLDLENEMLSAKSMSDRIAICESFLLRRLSNKYVIDKIINDSVEVILKSKGNLSVAEISDSLNINRRMLERRFSSVVGISPKQLAKILRLQMAIKLLVTKRFTSLTALAYEGSYYDQAHFIKDFKEFTGQSPKKYYADDLQLSTFFNSAE